jgi:hypothetical protein
MPSLIPEVGYCGIMLNDLDLASLTSVLTVSGNIRVNKFKVFANNLTDAYKIYAHYGNIRAGGLAFTSFDTVASSNPDYIFETSFYAIDAQALFKQFNSLSTRYDLTQQISFDIATYVSERRTDITVNRNNNLYPKLNTVLSLVANDLQIQCIDTTGVAASEHIANALGIAEATMTSTVKLTLSGIDNSGSEIYQKSAIIANLDYTDEKLAYTLPSIPDTVVALQVYAYYIVSIETLSETMTFTNTMVLTDEQIAQLRPVMVVQKN